MSPDKSEPRVYYGREEHFQDVTAISQSTTLKPLLVLKSDYDELNSALTVQGKAWAAQRDMQQRKIEGLEALLAKCKEVLSEYEKRFSIHTTEKTLSGCPKCKHQIYTKKRSINNPTCQCVNCGHIGEDWQFEPKSTQANLKATEG